MSEDKNEILDLVKKEIIDAKLKAFDKVLHHMLSRTPTEEAYVTLNDVVIQAYQDYVRDIKRLTAIYSKVDKGTCNSMKDFLKDLDF